MNHTRIWVNELNIPILSVDYRMAPEHKFPMSQNEAFQAYYWLVTRGLDELGIQADKLAIAGDSAGGYLCFSTMTQIIIRNTAKKEDQIRVPDALVSLFPVFTLEMEEFYPSMLN